MAHEACVLDLPLRESKVVVTFLQYVTLVRSVCLHTQQPKQENCAHAQQIDADYKSKVRWLLGGLEYGEKGTLAATKITHQIYPINIFTTSKCLEKKTLDE